MSEHFTVKASPTAVWESITDPHFVVACMPGAEILAEREDGTLEGALLVQLGPTAVRFLGQIVPTFDQAAREGTLLASGADGRGRTKAQATTTFRVCGEDEGSRVEISGDILVSGGLAAFVRTGGVHLTRRMVAEFAGNMSVRLSTPPAAAGIASAPPQAAKPIKGLRLIWLTVLDIIRAGWRRVRASLHRNPTGG